MLASAWRPYVETSIEAFGASRAMFESNFPVDKGQAKRKKPISSLAPPARFYGLNLADGGEGQKRPSEPLPDGSKSV
jgi:hypothetical protein